MSFTTYHRRKRLPAYRVRSRAGGKEIDLAPLTLGQRHFLASEALRPGSSNVELSWSLPGIDATIAVEALHDLAIRHDALHSVIARSERRQIPLAGWRPVIEIADPECVSRLMPLNRPFRMGREPLFRARIVAKDDALSLQLATSHLVFDAWTAVVIQVDLERLIGRSLGAKDALPDPPSFLSQASRLSVRETTEGPVAREFWQAHLGDITLPGDATTPPMGAMDTVDLALGRVEIERLHRLQTDSETTAFVVAAALVGCALYDLTGDNPIIWTTVANRTTSESWNTVGLFANVIPLRLPATRSLESAVIATQQTTIAALAFAEFPLAEILRAVGTSLTKLSLAPGLIVGVREVTLPGNLSSSPTGSAPALESGQRHTVPDYALPFHILIDVAPSTDVKWARISFRTGLRSQAMQLVATVRALAATLPARP